MSTDETVEIDDEEIETGSLEKNDKQYKKNINRVTSKRMKPGHPRHNGIHMQAHHLLSQKAFSEITPKLEELIIDRGYDIDRANNLSYIPSTLPGACHLSIQPHRGDHLSKDDRDADHPDDYHTTVKKLIAKFEKKIEECSKKSKAGKKSTGEILDGLSKKVAGMIVRNKLRLTDIHASFKGSSFQGCGNSIDINDHEGAAPCRSRRDHYGETHALYKPGKQNRSPRKITIAKSRFIVRPGN
jgi:hypothetical protein